MFEKDEVILEAKHVTRRFTASGGRTLIANNDINLKMYKGKTLGLVGESGCGKSTFMRFLVSLDTPSEGEILYRGKDITKMNKNELADLRLDEMGFIFQQMYMLRNLTILDNIILPAVQSKKTNDSKAKKVQNGIDIMRKLGIIEIADNDINEVSGGQLQRACICRSLINNPRVIFADEPTGALNRTSSNEVMEELLKINQSGTTIMLVTHDVKVAAKCSRVLYIVDGNIKGEYNLGRIEGSENTRERERELNNWLLEFGW